MSLLLPLALATSGLRWQRYLAPKKVWRASNSCAINRVVTLSVVPKDQNGRFPRLRRPPSRSGVAPAVCCAQIPVVLEPLLREAFDIGTRGEPLC